MFYDSYPYEQLIKRQGVMLQYDFVKERVLFIANGPLPTLDIYFLMPLDPLIGSGKIEVDFLFERDLTAILDQARKIGDKGVIASVTERIAAFGPTLIVFCRYSGVGASVVVDYARTAGIPTIFHIDDDLLRVPIEFGPKKYAMHNHPDRIGTINYLLDNTTIVFCSNEALRQRLFGDELSPRVMTFNVCCSHEIMAPPTTGGTPIIGYMGFDHAHDFSLVLPALIRLLDERPEVVFEMFGSVPIPDDLSRFGDRIRVIEPIRNYKSFLERQAALGWTIGICPLADTPFNAVKTDLKWVEYTASGFATIASRGMVYNRCCSDGCGLLVEGEEEWFAAFEVLLDDVAIHRAQVERAQERLRSDFNPERIRAQTLAVFAQAHRRAMPEIEPSLEVLPVDAPAVEDAPSSSSTSEQIPVEDMEPSIPASPSDLLSLDDVKVDNILGWAWSKANVDASGQEPIELLCGSVRLGSRPCDRRRSDVDALVGNETISKGFQLPGGCLFALWMLLGRREELRPSVRFRDTVLALPSASPVFSNLMAFRTLRSLDGQSGWQVADIWWANCRLLKFRTNDISHLGNPAVLLTVFQVLPGSGGLTRLSVVDELPLSPETGAAVLSIGVRNPLMPVLLIGKDAAGNLRFVDLIPFPSLFRGGLHETESAAIGPEGGTLADICRLNDSYLAEAAGWGGDAPAPVVGDVAVDLLRATGAERIFDPAVRQWLANAFGITISAANEGGRKVRDFDDPGFTDFALEQLAAWQPDVPRTGGARLHLPSDSIPTIAVAVARRLAVPTSGRPGPVIVTDDAFPHRRSLVAFPSPVSPDLYQDQGAGLEDWARLTPAEGGYEATGEGESVVPVAIAFRDLEPLDEYRRLHPVPTDRPTLVDFASGREAAAVTAIVWLPSPAADIAALVESIGAQHLEAACEVIVLIANHTVPQIDQARAMLEARLPGGVCLRVVDAPMRLSEAFNQAANVAKGAVLVCLDASVILHDARTIATFARMTHRDGVGTVGCMMLASKIAKSTSPAYLSAGLFPGRVDFTVAPHLGLSMPDCSVILPNAIYPVVANAHLCYAVLRKAWQSVGGLDENCLAQGAAETDLAVRLAEKGLTNLCTTKLSAFTATDNDEGHLSEIRIDPALGIWRLLPAIRASTVIRNF